MSGETHISIPPLIIGYKDQNTKKKKRKGKHNADLRVCPCTICVLYREVITYPLHHGGLCKDYCYSPEFISCSMLTDNDECIRVYYGEGRTLVLLHYYPFSRM